MLVIIILVLLIYFWHYEQAGYLVTFVDFERDTG